MNVLRKCKVLLIMALLLCVLAACSMDAMGESGMYASSDVGNYKTWGIVTTVGTDFYVKTDEGKELKLRSFDNTKINLKKGDRVFLVFTIYDDNSLAKYNGATFNYDVIVKSLHVVPYSAIKEVTQEEKSKFLNGFVTINGVKVTANNLNLELECAMLPNVKNDLQLCYTIDAKTDLIVLELIDTTIAKQTSGAMQKKLRSFDISKLAKWKEKDREGKISFMLVVNKGSEREQNYTLTYEP